MYTVFSLPVVFLSVLEVAAIPIHVLPPPVPRAQVSSVTEMTSNQLSVFAPYSHFAMAAYCSPSIIQNWSCGQACDAIPDFQVSLAGGDGNAIQYYYVGYWESSNSVVVAHQGTNPAAISGWITDLDATKENLNSSLFPGIDSTVQVHSGFANEHAKTAPAILNQVQSLISQKGATSVAVIGHSLGGAVAELECLFLALHLPSNISIKGVTYGTPRVGNAAWASLFNSKVSDFQRINNKKDPIVPGIFMGFSHVAGEVHIIEPDNAVECPGDDDTTDSQCTVMSVPSIVDGNIFDHMGPYQGIYIGALSCSSESSARPQNSVHPWMYWLLAGVVVWMGGQY